MPTVLEDEALRILHVVTLVSPDGAFGGPLRVAINQCRALGEMGHDVTLVAAVRGYATLPTEIDGVPLRAFAARSLPGVGLVGTTAPGLRRWVLRQQADLVHVHLGRDLVTLPVARSLAARGRRWVAQPHGMITRTAHPAAPVLDALATRPSLRAAGAVLHLTSAERADLADVVGELPTYRLLPNGVPCDVPADREAADDVLFLARLARRKRPEVFAAAARELLPRHAGWTFSLVGPDEGAEAQARQAAGGDPRVRFEGPLPVSQTAARMRASSVYVLPAVDEPFGMTVVEAMVQERPVVVTRSCGLAAAVERAGAGVVVDDDPAALAAGVETLLRDPDLRERAGRAGRALVEREFSIEAVTEQLERVYREVAA